MKLMSEGTKSYLFGCHHFILHPYSVLKAWRKEYKSWPTWWELICILLHDIGICGREYLSDGKAKRGHWEKGADLSFNVILLLAPRRRQFYLAYRAYIFCAGHCPSESDYTMSRLYRADKKSWLEAPMWWLRSNARIEKFVISAEEWVAIVRKQLEHKGYNGDGAHSMYMNIRSLKNE